VPVHPVERKLAAIAPPTSPATAG